MHIHIVINISSSRKTGAAAQSPNHLHLPREQKHGSTLSVKIWPGRIIIKRQKEPSACTLSQIAQKRPRRWGGEDEKREAKLAPSPVSHYEIISPSVW